MILSTREIPGFPRENQDIPLSTIPGKPEDRAVIVTGPFEENM